MRLPPELPELPVKAALDTIVGSLAEHGAAVLVAPPGSGKTTLVPLALGAADRAKVMVAEPRRLAARAAANRMASLLGEPVGRSVGYSVRGDSRTSAATRIEVVTSGLLLRRLATDPELVGVGTVVLDECHERHLDADLLLAMLLDVRAGLRPDLRLLATSATVAADRLASLLGGDTPAPVLEVAARAFPVAVRHLPPARGERLEATVARAVGVALDEGDGDVLVFLPGVGEIWRTQGLLAGTLAGTGTDVLVLHGRLPSAEQDNALRPGPGRRVVLATAVAESSLTVPGVRAVVDAGLARTPRVDHRRGLAGLVTVRVSGAVAEQRAGRAGREAPGRVYRCWPEAEHLTRYPEPEIRTADLTRLALDLACWGTPDGSALRWWDAPAEGPLRAGQDVLWALGAIDHTGAATERGRRMAGLGLHPRLARALLDGAEMIGRRAAAEVVALLDDDTLADGIEVDRELARLRSGTGGSSHRWRTEVGRLAALVPTGSTPTHRSEGSALVIGLAHPERLARRRASGQPLYLMAGGTAVALPETSPIRDALWIAVAVADRAPGAQNARARLVAVADQELAELVAPALLRSEEEVHWDSDVVARQVTRLGAIVLAERALVNPDRTLLREALLSGLRAEGTGLLSWSKAGRALRDRLSTLQRVLGPPWPEVSDQALLADPDRWWSGPLLRARNRADLARIDAGTVLRSLLDWKQAADLDRLAPERITVPTGSAIALDYAGEQPVLAVKVQEVFGWTASPTVADGRMPVLLHLLSPAGRPAAVTADLTSFWTSGYPGVRAELRGRYPKHDWPLDPLAATPSRRPKRTGR
ncbi:MAG TPA: ATP-dependent helicase HrpB [Pseudonocardia sp.]|nr:ATP-dependent helicase HrpB [Pseudonocardia sp.]